MADFNKPTVDSEYTQFPTEIRAAISAALSFLDGEHTNIPLKAKRWNPSSKIFEEYNGTQWMPMATEYKLPVDYNSLKNKPTPNSAVNDESDTKFASSAAVKTAYDKGVEAEELANTKWTAKSATETEPGILPISHKTDGTDKNKFASEYAVGEAAKKGLPLGAVVSFPRAVTNPVGFLKANGTTFNEQTFPDLYQVLGSNKLPDLTRSDVGMTAYFAVDNIPAGWIAFDEIATQVTEQRYPELYRHLVDKYGSISAVPKAEDRFIRNAGNGLFVGQTQEDAIRDITGQLTTYRRTDRPSLKMPSGAFKMLERVNGSMGNGGGDDWAMTVNFAASNVVQTANENRPKSLVLKLCIKAINSLDDVVFWIKSHGEVTNAGALDAGRLAQGLQDKADRNHTHTVRQITDFNQSVKDIVSQPVNQGFTQNLSEIGWCKLPNGLILQWGHGPGGSTGEGNILMFPIAFTTQCLAILATDVGGGAFSYGISPISTTQFKVWGREVVRGKLAGGGFRWVAIGR